MPTTSKITKYRLKDRVLMLREQGCSTYKIARIITKEFQGKDSLSQSAVSRFLKKARKQREKEPREILLDHLNKTLPRDAKVLEEIKANLLIWLKDEGLTKAEQLLYQRAIDKVDTTLRKIRRYLARRNGEIPIP